LRSRVWRKFSKQPHHPVSLSFCFGFLAVLFLIPGLGEAVDDTKPHPVIFDGTYLSISAKDVPLETLILEIRNTCGVETTGLENRLNDSVTLAVEKRAPETVFKRLLRQLGKENYAFEFSDSKLRRVSVFPAKADSQDEKRPSEIFGEWVSVDFGEVGKITLMVLVFQCDHTFTVRAKFYGKEEEKEIAGTFDVVANKLKTIREDGNAQTMECEIEGGFLTIQPVDPEEDEWIKFKRIGTETDCSKQ